MQPVVLLAEAIFIGIYTTVLYGILQHVLSLTIIPNVVLYFYLGFYKHLLGYYTGIHDYYCNNGYACVSYDSRVSSDTSMKRKAISEYIIFDSILEGLLFVSVCTFAMVKKWNPYLNIFIIGVMMHLFAELFGVHKIFCEYRCS